MEVITYVEHVITQVKQIEKFSAVQVEHERQKLAFCQKYLASKSQFASKMASSVSTSSPVPGQKGCQLNLHR